jgi:hypothetical protein
MMNTMAVLPMTPGEPSEVLLPGARAPGGGEGADEGEGFLGMLQQLLVTGAFAPAPAVQQPVPVETEAPWDPRSPASETDGAAAGAAGEPQAPAQAAEQPGVFGRTGEISLPQSSGASALFSGTPVEVPPEPEFLSGAGQMTEMVTNAPVKETPLQEVSLEVSQPDAPVTRMAEPERKIAMTQSDVVAAMLDPLDEAKPFRMADVPAVIREEIEAGRPPAASLSRDMTWTAVAEGVREYERQHTGNARGTGVRSVAAATGVARGESKPRPLFTTTAPVPDDVPKAARSEVQSAASAVGTSLEGMPEEHRVHTVIGVREEVATPEEGAQTKRAPQEVMQVETRENVQPDVKEKEGMQPKAAGPAGTAVTDGESLDKAAGRSPLPHGHTGTAPVRSDGVRITEGGVRTPELFQTLPPDTARDVVDQVVKGLALKVQGGLSEVRIRLEPESLGEVVVNMRMENGKLQAQIDVSQAGVKGVLDGNLGQLRQSLSARGIEVQRLDVVFSGGSGARGSEGGQGERQRRYGSRQPLAAEAVEQYQTGRLLGYNTMEMVM